jgi:hypothetical protein
MERRAVVATAHLFGHLHEQRGYWQKTAVCDPDDPCSPKHWLWTGGCEYEAQPGVKWPTFPPPGIDYGCEFISCNAMKNHGGLDGRQPCIAGPGRLIYARQDPMCGDHMILFSASAAP